MMDQTELTTIATTADYIAKIAKMKIKDSTKDKKMRRVKNVIIFDNFKADDYKADEKHKQALELAAKADLTLYTFHEVEQAGKNAANKTI